MFSSEVEGIFRFNNVERIEIEVPPDLVSQIKIFIFCFHDFQAFQLLSEIDIVSVNIRNKFYRKISKYAPMTR